MQNPTQNTLSIDQGNSSEVMRRIESVLLAWQMVRFVGIDKFMKEKMSDYISRLNTK